jgi:hypothetical protein
MCRKAYGKLAGWQSDAGWQDGVESYRGMIEVSRALMKVLRSAHPRMMPLVPVLNTAPFNILCSIAGQNGRAATGCRHCRLSPGADSDTG